MKCFVCGSAKSGMLFSIEGYPVLHYPVDKLQLAEFRKLGLPSKAKLAYAICDKCGACLLEKKDGAVENAVSVIYSKFYNYPSPLKDGIATEEADKVFELLKGRLGKRKKILEIGCYDGYLLYLLSKEGHDVTGCDPSRGADIGREFGIRIIKEYYKPELFGREQFDVVIFRNLIEHLPATLEFVGSIAKVVKPGGLMVIQTPNLGYHLKEGSMVPFHFEHVVLFDGRLLSHCLAAAGFSTEEMLETPEDLLAIGKKDGVLGGLEIDGKLLAGLMKLARQYRKKLEQDQEETAGHLARWKKGGKKVALWGAGGGSALFIAMHPDADFRYIVDNDSRKWGNSYLFADVRIVPPETLDTEPPDVILINSTFFREIHEQIKESGVKCEVWDTLPNFKRFK